MFTYCSTGPNFDPTVVPYLFTQTAYSQHKKADTNHYANLHILAQTPSTDYVSTSFAKLL